MERIPFSCRFCHFFRENEPKPCIIDCKEWNGTEHIDEEKTCSTVPYFIIQELDDEIAAVEDPDDQYEAYLNKYNLKDEEFMKYRKEQK